MDKIDILFYASISLMLLGLGFVIMFKNSLFILGGLMVGIGMFSMLLILAGKIFTVIVDGLVREY